MNKEIKKDSIFVSIASYRDSVCNNTVKSMLEAADNKNRVFIGICQQNKDEDEDCLLSFEESPNLKIIRIKHTEAKGPTYARYLCSTLWDGEEYYFQIDSHTKFVKSWDTKLINMIKKIKEKGLSKKPVISHYPKEITDYENRDKGTYSVPRMCKSFFNNRNMISFLGAEIMDTKKEFYQTPYVAGGMVFSEAYFLDELPYDPELPYLFVGEEILHSIRYYTNGWDIFTPDENIVFHEYTRKDKPKIWTDNPTYSDMDAFEKVKYYIGLVSDDSKIKDNFKTNLHKYGLGSKRSLQDYYNFAGIDINNKNVKKNFCKKDNIATDEDIFKSNEINHGKEYKKEVKENFTIFNNKSNKKIGVLYSVLIIIFLVILIIIIKFL